MYESQVRCKGRQLQTHDTPTTTNLIHTHIFYTPLILISLYYAVKIY